MTIKKFERITLDAIKYHTIENGRGVTLAEGEAHLEILADAGAVFNKDEALALFGQAVALAVE